MMTQIFVFTAGNPEARQHLEDSIENPIDEKTVFGTFASAYREELERIHQGLTASTRGAPSQA